MKQSDDYKYLSLTMYPLQLFGIKMFLKAFSSPDGQLMKLVILDAIIV